MFGYRKRFIHSCSYCAHRPQLEPMRWRQQLNDYCRVDTADQWICGQEWLEHTGWICTQHVRKTTVFYHHSDKQRQRILVRGTLSRGCSIECHWCPARYGYDTRFWFVRLLRGSFVGQSLGFVQDTLPGRSNADACFCIIPCLNLDTLSNCNPYTQSIFRHRSSCSEAKV